MQLCKCLNCFLKAHSKQLNQYCLNFIIIFYQFFFKNGLGHGSDWVDLQKNTVRVTGQPIFASGKKNWVQVRYFLGWVGLENSNPFCHV